jgi:hypothetical protein
MHVLETRILHYLAAHRLAYELEKAGAPTEMCVRAMLGYYDDFQSPVPFPKIVLIEHLMRAKLRELAERVCAGEFDSTREEAQRLFELRRDELRAWRKMRLEGIQPNGDHWRNPIDNPE